MGGSCSRSGKLYKFIIKFSLFKRFSALSVNIYAFGALCIFKLTIIFSCLIARLLFNLSLFLNSNQGMHSAILYYISCDCNCLHSSLKLMANYFY